MKFQSKVWSRSEIRSFLRRTQTRERADVIDIYLIRMAQIPLGSTRLDSTRLDSTRSTLSSQSSKSRRARRAVLIQHGGRRTILYKF